MKVKIWKARFTLTENVDCEIVTRFTFEKEEKDYEVNKNHPNEEWITSTSDWTIDRVPKNMKVSQMYGVYTVEQGFDRGLSSSELDNLKIEMGEFLKEHIIKERDTQIAYYDRKVSMLENI